MNGVDFYVRISWLCENGTFVPQILLRWFKAQPEFSTMFRLFTFMRSFETWPWETVDLWRAGGGIRCDPFLSKMEGKIEFDEEADWGFPEIGAAAWRPGTLLAFNRAISCFFSSISRRRRPSSPFILALSLLLLLVQYFQLLFIKIDLGDIIRTRMGGFV